MKQDAFGIFDEGLAEESGGHRVLVSLVIKGRLRGGKGISVNRTYEALSQVWMLLGRWRLALYCVVWKIVQNREAIGALWVQEEVVWERMAWSGWATKG